MMSDFVYQASCTTDEYIKHPRFYAKLDKCITTTTLKKAKYMNTEREIIIMASDRSIPAKFMSNFDFNNTLENSPKKARALIG